MKFSPAIEFVRAWRRLLRTPAFSLGVIGLLAISIGGTVAIATAAYSLFVQPLPYHQPDRLVTIGVFSKRFGVDMGLSAALVEELDRSDEFGDLAIVGEAFDLELVSGESLRAGRIDHRVLDLVGLRPSAGRAFTEADVQPGADRVALVSQSLLRDRFGNAESALGSYLDAEAGRVRIVGVVADRLAMPESRTGVWLPLELGADRIGADQVGQFGDLMVLARTGADETPIAMQERLIARLDADPRLTPISSMLETDYRIRPLREIWSRGEAESLMILGSALGLVLIASILNVAGLWMARWFGRSQEIAIQSALGGRQRMVLVGAAIEFSLLALPAVALSLVVAGGCLALLYHLDVFGEHGPLTGAPLATTAMIGGVLVVASAVPVLLSLLWQMRGTGRAAARHLTGGGVAIRAHGMGLRRILMVGQIGIAFSLLMVLALLYGSWRNLLDEELGFAQDRLVAMQIQAEGESAVGGGSDPRVAALAERLGGLPGVDAVSWANVVPFGRVEMLSSVTLEEGESVPARPRSVGPGFFRVAGIELLEGRRFDDGDAAEDARNVIVDRPFVERYLRGRGPGASFDVATGPDSVDRVTVVGVVAPVRHMSPDEQDATPTVYTHSPEPGAAAQLLLRAAVPPESLVQPARDIAIGQLGEDRVGFVSSLESLVRRTVRQREPQLVLMAIFSGLAVTLVFYGLFALQSYHVAARTPELGLRKALGAADRDMLAEVMGRGMLLLVPGLMLGIAGGLLGARLVAERLYSVSLATPALWAGVAVAIGAVVAAATLVPARRASRITPMAALRYD